MRPAGDRSCIAVHHYDIEAGERVCVQTKRFAADALYPVSCDGSLGSLFRYRHPQPGVGILVTVPKDRPVLIGNAFVAAENGVVVLRRQQAMRPGKRHRRNT